MKTVTLLWTSLIALAGLSCLHPGPEPARAAPVNESSRALFERRILPLLKSPNPSSCAECHLSGVDLKDYVRPSEADTFASLRDGGLIDLKNPSESHLLELIKKSTPKTALVRKEAREAELSAFTAWIEAAAKDPALARTPALPKEKRAGPAVPDAVIRHTRMDRVVESFMRNVWSQEGRCMGCHRPGTPEFAEKKKQFGDRVEWFVPDSAEATMQRIIERKLVNVDQPDQSLLLLKPLNKVPHGGGVKFLYGDVGYKQFRAWIEDYAASVKGKYRAVRDLPADAKEALVFTDCILNLNETPEAWGDKLLRVDVHAWDAAKNAWSPKPLATGDRGVWAKGRSTNVLLFLSVPAGGEAEKAARRSPRIPPGKYLMKYYCDTQGKLAADYKIPTDLPAFYQGQQEITSDWRTGWGSPTKVAVRLQ